MNKDEKAELEILERSIHRYISMAHKAAIRKDWIEVSRYATWVVTNSHHIELMRNG